MKTHGVSSCRCTIESAPEFVGIMSPKVPLRSVTKPFASQVAAAESSHKRKEARSLLILRRAHGANRSGARTETPLARVASWFVGDTTSAMKCKRWRAVSRS